MKAARDREYNGKLCNKDLFEIPRRFVGSSFARARELISATIRLNGSRAIARENRP